MAKNISWDTSFNSSPTDGDKVGLGYADIQETREGVQERLSPEHEFDLSVGTSDRQGLHKAGSAVAFYQASAPTQRNGVALGADDIGIEWCDSDTGLLYFWTGTDWRKSDMFTEEVRLTSGSGNWTVPAGVFRLRVKCIGGGGGGSVAIQSGPIGGYYFQIGGAGGGGTLISDVPWSYLNVTPGSSIAYVIGAAGAAGAGGGQTTFTGATSGPGGGAGAGNIPGDGAAITGGLSGAAGATYTVQTNTIVTAIGGHGGGSHGAKPNPNGTPAAAGAGGGGAGGSINGTTLHPAGAGGPGLIIIEY